MEANEKPATSCTKASGTNEEGRFLDGSQESSEIDQEGRGTSSKNPQTLPIFRRPSERIRLAKWLRSGETGSLEPMESA